MKKYVKPELFYEHYELSQHIADCSWEYVNALDPNNCYAAPDENAPIPGANAFQNPAICAVNPDEIFEDFCYQSSTTGFNTFTS